MTYFDFIIVLLSLVLPSAAVVAITKRRFEEVLPLVIFSIVFSLYLFGCFDLLRSGFYIITAVMLALFVNAYFQIKRDVILFTHNLFSPGLLIYVLCCFLIFLLVNNYSFVAHDTFSHWGLAAKNTFILNTFPIGSDANTAFQDYPPATYLFQYWLLRVVGSYSESLVTYSMSLWGFALLIPLFKEVRWGDYKLILLATIFSLVFPLILLWGNSQTFTYTFYTILSVDFLMGLLFGYIVFLIISLRDCKPSFELFTLALALIALVLIKKVGVVLAIIAVVLGLADIFVTGKRLGFSGGKNIIFMKIFFCFFGPVVIAFYSWDVVIQLYDASRVTMNNAHSELLAKAVTGDRGIFPAYADEVFATYVNALYNKPLTSGAIQLSFVAVVLLLSTCIFILYYRQNDNTNKSRIFYASMLLLLFTCIYLVGHMLMYVAILSHGESVGLSSFRRYLAPLLLGVMYVLSGFLIHYASKSKNFTSRYSLALLTVLAVVSLNPALFDTVKYRKTVDLRFEFENAISPISQLISKHKNSGQMCFLGPEGSVNFYMTNLYLNYISAPVGLKRFVMYSVTNEEYRKWHIYSYNKFLLEECSTVLSFFESTDDTIHIDDYYIAPFNEDAQFLGLYSVVKSTDDEVSLSLLDCSLCGRRDIIASTDKILKMQAKLQ